MRVFPISILCGAFGLLIPQLAIAQGDSGDQCRDILTYAARNDTLQDYAFAAASDIYSEYCENDHLQSGKSVSGGVDAVIGSLPLGIGFGSGSSSDQMTQFCKKFSDMRSQYMKNNVSKSLVNQPSVVAWQKCVELQAQGVSFKPDILDTQITIEIKRTTGAPVTLKGVTIDPSLLACTIPGPSSGGEPVKVGDGTYREIENDDLLSISCTRAAHPDGDTVTYPKADITVRTNKGDLAIPIPAASKTPYQWSEYYEQQLKNLASRVVDAGSSDQAYTDKKVDELRMALGSWGTADPTQTQYYGGASLDPVTCRKGAYLVGFSISRGSAGINELKLICNDLNTSAPK